jgi:hypothetical protein
MPAAGWANNADPAKDSKLNMLRKHDDRAGTSLAALAAVSPVSCSSCHADNAISKAGIGIEQLTTAVHRVHAAVVDPATGQLLASSTTRTSCYYCHPGPTTQELRGVHGTLKDTAGNNQLECQSCHGPISNVADATRQGWMNLPNCQSCHTGTATSNSGQIVYTSAFTTGTTMRVAADQTFATNPDTPSAGLSLFRSSTGHGGLFCEACHGSTHAESPSSNVNDNVQNVTIQGHGGALVECASCHRGTVPSPTNGGPHGMHVVGQSWVSGHQDAGGGAACQACHGTDYRGTILSKMLADRTMSGRSFPTGTVISCYNCHNGPGGGD